MGTTTQKPSSVQVKATNSIRIAWVIPQESQGDWLLDEGPEKASPFFIIWNGNYAVRRLYSTLFNVMLLLISSQLFAANESSLGGMTHQLTDQLTGQLTTAKLKQMPHIVEQLEAQGGENMLPLFSAMLAGELYYRKDDRRLVHAKKLENSDFTLIDVITSEALGDAKKKTIKKIRVNNRLRTKLRSAISRLTLFSSDRDTREAAIKNMLNALDDGNVVLLSKAKVDEKDQDLLVLIATALALNDLLNSAEIEKRLVALDDLSNSLEPIVKSSVDALLEKDDDDNFIESNAVLRDKAAAVAKKIDGKIGFYNFLEKLFFGLSLGSVLLLAATGLAITFGVMGVINMAHGELIMIGAYTTYVIQQLMPNAIEYSLLVAVPAAFLVAGFVGVLIERGVIRFLHGRPLETLLATFGISLILQQMVRSVFSPLNRQVETPQWMSGSLEFNAIFSITYNRLYILVFALLVFFALQFILKRTSLGLNVRAVSQNRDMAKAMGIRTAWVDAMTFGLGSGIAGVAGVALSQLTNVGPNLGQSYIIDSFMVVVFGGVGNLWGTLVAGFTLGITNKFLEPVTGAVLANIIVLVFIILFIQKRPRGLFPQKGRAAE